jgi:uncharacterized protein YkwD
MRFTAFALALLLLASTACALDESDVLTTPGATSVPSPTVEGGAGAPVDRESPGIDMSRLELAVHDLTNVRRRNRGLSILEWDEALSAVARKHSEDMATRSYFAHTSPEGENATDRCRREDYPIRRIPAGGGSFSLSCTKKYYLGCSENLFKVSLAKRKWSVGGRVHTEYYTEEEIASRAVQGWMESPGHRENLLTPFWESEGIGVAVAADGSVYVTQNFN